MDRARHVALILNVNKPYDRKVIAGIGRYVRSVGRWSLYVEDEPLAKMPNLRQWQGDGIIADFDDLHVARAVSDLKIPVVGIGGGYGGYNPRSRAPYVGTNNRKIAELAAEHLLERGFRRFAYCGLPRTGINRWSEERGAAFYRTVREAGRPCATYVGRHATARRWEGLQGALTAWLESLDRPVGLMACNDARARHVLEACRRIAARVPEDVAVVGVDNDVVMCDLAIPPLSSVIQGTDRIGYEAANLLDRLMNDEPNPKKRIVIDPVGIATRQSTDILAIEDPRVAAAVRFIRERAGGPIQVLDVVRMAGVSRSTLDGRFRRILGRTIHDEIDRVQVRCVQDLLLHTDLPLKQVAERAGYNTVQYMTRVFGQRMGQTPGEYRRRARGA